MRELEILRERLLINIFSLLPNNELADKSALLRLLLLEVH